MFLAIVTRERPVSPAYPQDHYEGESPEVALAALKMLEQKREKHDIAATMVG